MVNNNGYITITPFPNLTRITVIGSWPCLPPKPLLPVTVLSAFFGAWQKHPLLKSEILRNRDNLAVAGDQ